MTNASADFPDWNPPRDRAAFRTVDTIFTNVAPGDEFEPSYDAIELDNAVIVQGTLAPSTACHVGALGLFGQITNLRGAINAGLDTVPFVIVSAFLGVAVYIDLINASASNWPVLTFVDTAAGVPADLVLPQQLMQIKNAVVVPGLGASDPLVIGNAGEYTNATILVTCDQPYTVTVRRSWLDLTGVPAIVSVDELVGTAAGGAPVNADVAVGANGFAVIVTGMGATAGAAQVAVRLYRSGGY